MFRKHTESRTPLNLKTSVQMDKDTRKSNRKLILALLGQTILPKNHHSGKRKSDTQGNCTTL